jgi:hypothetical protein
MGSHFHLLLETPAANLSGGMLFLFCSQAPTIFSRQGGSGSLRRDFPKRVPGAFLALPKLHSFAPPRGGQVGGPGRIRPTFFE